MAKGDVRLKLSFSGRDRRRADRFLGALQDLIDEAAADGLEVTVNSNGSEVSVMKTYDASIYTLQSELDAATLSSIRDNGMRPEGVWEGTFVYRKDSLALLKLRVALESGAVVSLN